MVVDSLRPLEDFGVRSLVTHALMVASFAGAVASALFLEGQVGLVSFVAFVNFTAGLWVSQSIHALGNAFTDDDYEGLVSALRAR